MRLNFGHQRLKAKEEFQNFDPMFKDRDNFQILTSEKLQEIGRYILLNTKRKSHMTFSKMKPDVTE